MFESFLPDEFLVNIYQGVYILQFPEYNTLLRKKKTAFLRHRILKLVLCMHHSASVISLLEKKKVALLSCTVYIVFLQFVM